jgi:hypothetical protein
LTVHLACFHDSVHSPLLPFPIAVPGFLGALAALGTSRRKVNSHQRLAALPSMSLIPELRSVFCG